MRGNSKYYQSYNSFFFQISYTNLFSISSQTHFFFDFFLFPPFSSQFYLISLIFLIIFPGPFIVAGPLATLTNWLNEFKKWLPSCPVVLYHGSKQEREELR